jgi:hypothetical protein
MDTTQEEENQRQKEQEQTNKYNKTLTNYIKEIPGRMFTFEVTKCCDYSTFVLMYKEENLVDLYGRVSLHFGHDIVSLYIISPDKERIRIPLNGTKTIKEFIYSNFGILKPIYDIPLPVVYRIYVDDGHSHNHDH